MFDSRARIATRAKKGTRSPAPRAPQDGKVIPERRHAARLVRGCDGLGALFPCCEVGVLLGGELIDPDAHRLELETRDFLVDLLGHWINALLE